MADPKESTTFEIQTFISKFRPDFSPSLDPFTPEDIEKVKKIPHPLFSEFSEYLSNTQGFGSGPEYLGRLARIYEYLEIENPLAKHFRDKLEWFPEDEVDLHKLIDTIEIGEVLCITDYKNRYYRIKKEPNGFRIVTAYNEQDKPINQLGLPIKDQTIQLLKMPNPFVNQHSTHSPTDTNIQLVKPGTDVFVNDRHIEYFERIIFNRPINQKTSRIQIMFQDLSPKFSYGILPSSIRIESNDVEESDRLEAAKWRIGDSIFKLRIKLASNASDVKIRAVTVSDIEFFDNDEMTFTVTSKNKIEKFDISPTRGCKVTTINKDNNGFFIQSNQSDSNYVETTLPLLEAAQLVDKLRYAVYSR